MKIGLEFLENGKYKELGKYYRGQLTSEQASTFITKTVQNAQELVEDARLLLLNERYSRSLSLSILALEETGKIGLIMAIFTSSQTEIKTRWSNLYKHKEKNFTALIPMLNELRETISARDFSNSTNSAGYYNNVIDDIKMASIYAGITATGIPFSPEERISIQLAQFFLDAAHNMAYAEYIYTKKESLEIWYKYHIENDKHSPAENFINMYTEMLEHDIISQEKFDMIISNIKKLAYL